ncbi:DUF4238 domain-containing protein [Alicyclobacillus acidoterrestris]|uniref:DUF4238 domain-containing protein n=1 Tax=Alicyclobacillus acidoterrestris (strain ATCC 49025 / DSM 3922 / CIP 106132 / NCIMB 13137 / GD3B) TaxID=1356854 RepID=T0BKG8_ALIAG|nr:DUF4238 domain-containing protein [Alicyclobacillus acidoterrestris]EPZ44473.1 hypothetical protein N007_10945 [Alicyclobacillus acidoterrestris ATCC 49025]UNO49354.1 DUF4238 domain-containing protein [Alicyclobacillus acidoterrestris]
MGDSQKVILQHYVPRMYLKHFSRPDKRAQLFVFDKEVRKSFPSSVNNIAAERFFYDLPPVESKELDFEDDPQVVEKIFSELENVVSRILKKVISSYYMTPRMKLSALTLFSPEERGNLVIYIVLQLLRTPKAREMLTEFQEKLMTAYLKTQVKSGQLRGLRVQMKEEAQSLHHAEILFTEAVVDKLCFILAQYIWCVAYRTSEEPIYTSDNPVVAYNHISKQIKMSGYGVPGIEILFPLNPDLLLILREPTHFHKYLACDGKFVELRSDATNLYNGLQVLLAKRFVFSSTNDFSLAERIVEEYPNVSLGLDINKINQSAKEWFGKT